MATALLTQCTDELVAGHGYSEPDGAGGAAGASATEGVGAMAPTLECEFDVNASLSDVIPTVGIVEWSSNQPVDAAEIEFGLDTDYGMIAPVDLGEPDYRTLLLGMKPARQYHFRVRASVGSDQCESSDHTLTTGPLRNALGAAKIDTPHPEALAEGFMVTVDWADGPAFILDPDGDYVWWYDTDSVSRARMSYDGKYMWLLRANPSAESEPDVRRITMDGLEEEVFPEFGDAHHDLAALPGGGVAFIRRTEANCDQIVEWSPDGEMREVIDVGEAHGGGRPTCHTNSLLYWPEDDSLTFSDLFQNTYVKITREGEVLWVLGGDTSDFTGDGSSWENQHGHHLLSDGTFLFFNNGPLGGGSNGTSKAVELALDFDAMTATVEWEYETEFYTPIMGDVQRLHNGNTLVTFSAAGVIHEVDEDGRLLRSVSWPLGTALGYLTHRSTLYGPPPK